MKISLRQHMEYLTRFQNTILKSTFDEQQIKELKACEDAYDDVCMYILRMFNALLRLNDECIAKAGQIRPMIDQARIDLPKMIKG